MKVREFITMDIDIDVYDDVCEELGIAFCGPQPLTPEGQEHFAEVLDYEVNIHTCGGDAVATVCIDDPEDKIWKKRLRKAKEFFEGAAGYIACSDYDRWFGKNGDGK